MQKFDSKLFLELSDNFNRARKRIPFHRDISLNEDTLIDQKNDLIKSYNKIVSYSVLILPTLTKAEEENIKCTIQSFYSKLLLSLKRINFFINPGFKPKILDLIPIEKVKMAPSNLEFLKLCSSTIGNNFSGDPLKLKSFIDAVQLLETLAETTELKSLLVKIIKTKLDGTARDLITEDCDTVGKIKDVLNKSIKPENSKIIEGKLIALRIDRLTLQEFSEKVDSLSEAFKRSLVIEGIPAAKAEEMTINKTIDTCRANARSDLIKSVLASTTFSNNKEVVAKFIVEINNQRQDNQVLAYRNIQRNKNWNKHSKNQHNNGYST